MLSVVPIVARQCGSRVLVLHRIRLSLRRAIGRRRRVVIALRVAVIGGVVAGTTLVASHPAGTVPRLETLASAATRVDASGNSVSHRNSDSFVWFRHDTYAHRMKMARIRTMTTAAKIQRPYQFQAL